MQLLTAFSTFRAKKVGQISTVMLSTNPLIQHPPKLCFAELSSLWIPCSKKYLDRAEKRHRRGLSLFGEKERYLGGDLVATGGFDSDPPKFLLLAS